MLPGPGPHPRTRRGQGDIYRDSHYACSCWGSHRAHLSLTCGLTLVSPLIKEGLQAGSRLWRKEFMQAGMVGATRLRHLSVYQ